MRFLKLMRLTGEKKSSRGLKDPQRKLKGENYGFGLNSLIRRYIMRNMIQCTHSAYVSANS